ncbi:hypothetical protein E2C01_053134 [Portunus trituberculatus]|uniref:Uncharacterized protein n=1 Tax=Portunus trituberculatus TaxID=210409 RepID=A0A5B7GND7_PORTR|nr:hypothetical protein [Portunus trituberculatus]
MSQSATTFTSPHHLPPPSHHVTICHHLHITSPSATTFTTVLISRECLVRV